LGFFILSSFSLQTIGIIFLRVQQLMMENEIYPEIWDRQDSEDGNLDYLMEYFAVLRPLFQMPRKTIWVLLFQSASACPEIGKLGRDQGARKI
jgi:hypothetical protein